MDDVEKAKLKLELRGLRKKRAADNRSVNFYLLLLILILLVAMVGATFYFFWRHGAVIKEGRDFAGAKASCDTQLGECQNSLSKTLDEVGTLMSELNVTSSVRASLNELYTGLSNEKSQLEANLTTTKTTLSMCSLELSEAKGDLIVATNDLNRYIDRYNAKVNELKKANETIADYKSEVGSLKVQISTLNADIDDLLDCISDENCTACEDILD